MKEQEKAKTENQSQRTTTVTLSELNIRPGRIVRDVLRTQKRAIVTEYGVEVVEIRPLKRGVE